MTAFRANAESRTAAFEAQQERTDRQIAEMSKQIQAYAETQSQLVERNISGGNGNS
jgi:hypothetical protein